MSNSETPCYKYFLGCVPSGSIFWTNVVQLRDLVRDVDDEDVLDGLGTVVEVCYIGLIAYFEAFFKDHFASLINICPQLLIGFNEKSGIDTEIDVVDLLEFDEGILHQLGFLLVEKIDFGSAKRINTLYRSLISISPFSKDDISQYDQILRTRNLLVHHGGIFTMKYLRQEYETPPDEIRAFQDSLIVTRKRFHDAATFLEDISNKTSKAAKSALEKFIEAEEIELSGETQKALQWI